jgi:acetate kinase
MIEPTMLDGSTIAILEDVSCLAPLHNLPAVDAIKTVRESLGADMPMVAVFDTAFHSSLPEKVFTYAIRRDLCNRHGIRRFGFHGIAHRYMSERCALIMNVPAGEMKLITLQLGNGCSATAVSRGRSIDTSMGFTPLEGLIMGTRCGTIDPSIPGFLSQRENVDMEQVEHWLNKQSGLLGIAGTRDMQELLEMEKDGDSWAALAVDMFCYGVLKYIGAYIAALGGIDAIVFGGGMGENSPDIRARICYGLECFGAIIDHSRNSAAIGAEALITEDTASVQVYVIPVDEAIIIAKDTLSCLKSV